MFWVLNPPTNFINKTAKSEIKVINIEINKCIEIRDCTIGFLIIVQGFRDQFQIMKNKEKRERLDGKYVLGILEEYRARMREILYL